MLIFVKSVFVLHRQISNKIQRATVIRVHKTLEHELSYVISVAAACSYMLYVECYYSLDVVGEL